MPLRRTLVVSCFNFLTIGWLTAVLGPLLPDLSHNLGAPLVAVGAIVSALFVGALIAQLTGGLLTDRVGAKPLITTGLGIIVVGTAGIALSHNLATLLLCGVLAGIGHGTVDIATSVLVSVTAGERNVVALNFINVFFGAGAIAGPAAASLALRWWHTALPALWCIVVLALVLLPSSLQLPTVAHVEHKTTRAPYEIYRSPTLWALGIIFLLYVGIENGVGGWTTVYLQHTTTVSLSAAALIASLFWLALTVGRIIVTIVGERMTPFGVLLLSLGGLVVSAILLTASTHLLQLTIGAVVLLGLSCGPIFPTAFAITTSTFRANPGRAGSAVVALGSVGGIMIPWFQGLLLNTIDARLSMLFLAVLAALMIFVAQWLARSVAVG